MIAKTPAPKFADGRPAPPPGRPLGLPGILAHKKFPGRNMLKVPEVAKALRIDEKQVISLIHKGLIGAVEVTGRAAGTKESWRIPVDCYDDYIRRRGNTADGKRGK
jgi:hypothetical protein